MVALSVGLNNPHTLGVRERKKRKGNLHTVSVRETVTAKEESSGY